MVFVTHLKSYLLEFISIFFLSEEKGFGLQQSNVSVEKYPLVVA